MVSSSTRLSAGGSARRGSRHRVKIGGKNGIIKEVDLNEANHTELLFPSVALFNDKRLQYCKLLEEYGMVRDEATGKLPLRSSAPS